MSLIPTSSLKTLRRRVEAAMTDAIRLYVETGDPESADPYDTQEADLYDGRCSITDDVNAIAEMQQGDRSFEADAMCKMPLVDPFDQEAARAAVTYGGIESNQAVTRTARVERVMRKRTHMRLLLKWTTEAA